MGQRRGREVGQLGCGAVRLRPGCGRRPLSVPRIVGAFLHDVDDVIAGRDEFEDTAVHLPIPELLGLVGVMAQVCDMQPVAEIIEHDAALTPERAGRLGLPQRLDFVDAQLLAPVSGGGLEAEFLGGGQAANSTTSASDGPMPAS